MRNDNLPALCPQRNATISRNPPFLWERLYPFCLSRAWSRGACRRAAAINLPSFRNPSQADLAGMTNCDTVYWGERRHELSLGAWLLRVRRGRRARLARRTPKRVKWNASRSLMRVYRLQHIYTPGEITDIFGHITKFTKAEKDPKYLSYWFL